MWKHLVFVTLFCLVSSHRPSQPCRPKWHSPNHFDCECTIGYCDTMDVPDNCGRNEFVWVTSSRGGDRFNYTEGKFTTDDRYAKVTPVRTTPPEATKIEIKRIKTGRQFVGMGGAYTGGVTSLVQQMSSNLQENFYQSYYSSDFGSGFNKIRLPIGGSANDLTAWTYGDDNQVGGNSGYGSQTTKYAGQSPQYGGYGYGQQYSQYPSYSQYPQNKDAHDTAAHGFNNAQGYSTVRSYRGRRSATNNNNNNNNNNYNNNFNARYNNFGRQQGLRVNNPLDQSRINQLRDLISLTEHCDIDFWAVPYTAPTWMKRESTFFGSSLNPDNYAAYADYLISYLDLMKSNGINVSSISTGERPNTSPSFDRNAPSMQWDAIEQGHWLAEHFGPRLRNSRFSNVEIQAYDDDRSNIPGWVSLMNVGNISAINYIDAINIQGYADRTNLPSAIDVTYGTFLHKKVYMSEISTQGPPKPGSWDVAEYLIRDIMENLSHDTLAYLILNLIVDLDGGPTLNGQSFDAPIYVSDDRTTFYKQASYYGIAHFSRFIPPGSQRLDTYITGHDALQILTIAYLRPDGSRVVIVYNPLENPAPIILNDRYQGSLNLKLEPKSINTLIY